MSGSGDYISREAAKEAAWENIINNVVEEQGMYGYLVHLVDKVFDAIPAADVRPVRRGKWTDHRTIEHDGEWWCTACGKEITIYMGADRKDRYPFCPNCGADMREES